MFKDKMNFKLLNILIFCIVVYLIIITMNLWTGIFGKILSILSPFLIAFGIAYCLYPIVCKLKEKGVSNKLAVTIVATSIVIIFGVLIGITVPTIYNQLVNFSKSIGEVINDVSSKFEINLGDFKNTINNLLNSIIESLGTYVSSGTFSFLSNSISFVSNAIITFILSLYFLADMDSIRKEIKKLLTTRIDNNKLYNYIKKLDDELSSYLIGLVIFMGIHLVEYSLLFLIVGHPNWLLLGIFAAITTVIPYFGGIITNVIAIILATVVSTPVLIGTIIICIIFPNIDGYVISPKVYGKTNKINPLMSIFAVVAFGQLFGLFGIMFSLPLYIFIGTTFKYYKNDIYKALSGINDKRNA